jgi:hypothetical protein
MAETPSKPAVARGGKLFKRVEKEEQGGLEKEIRDWIEGER